jgi:hypothetical protein
MTAQPLISDIEAINIVGRAIFAKGWIGEARERDDRMALVGLSSEDLKLIADRGPQPGRRGRGTTIEPCPPTIEAQLDQALGRRIRAEAQRGTAAQWLLDHSIDAQPGRTSNRDTIIGYDPNAIIRVLKADPPKAPDTAAKQGAPAKYIAIGALMLGDVARGTRTEAEIKKASGKNLQRWYGADPATCRKAHKHVF